MRSIRSTLSSPPQPSSCELFRRVWRFVNKRSLLEGDFPGAQASRLRSRHGLRKLKLELHSNRTHSNLTVRRGVKGSSVLVPCNTQNVGSRRLPRWSSSFSLRIQIEDKLKLELQQRPPHSNPTIIRKFKVYKALVEIRKTQPECRENKKIKKPPQGVPAAAGSFWDRAYSSSLPW
jgi:hypothetical protein